MLGYFGPRLAAITPKQDLSKSQLQIGKETQHRNTATLTLLAMLMASR